MRWEVARNGLLSPRAGDVSGASGYPLTMDSAEPAPAHPEKMAESGESDGAWCTLRRAAPERLPCHLLQTSESATGPSIEKQKWTPIIGQADKCPPSPVVLPLQVSRGHEPMSAYTSRQDAASRAKSLKPVVLLMCLPSCLRFGRPEGASVSGIEDKPIQAIKFPKRSFSDTSPQRG